MRRALACLLLLFAPALSDDVLLRGGTRLSGTVLERTKQGLKLLTREGTEITLAAADVLSVLPDRDAPKAGNWVRFKKGKKYGGKLQVAVTHLLAPDGGPRLDLVSAVHIADPAYWVEIRRLLESAEVVLFELVKPKGISVPDLVKRKLKSKSHLSSLQRKLARWFDLQFQMEAINYDRPHFVHADLEIGRVPKQGEQGGLPKELKGLELMLDAVGPMLDKMMGDDTDPKAVKLRQHYKNVSARTLATLGDRAAILFGPKLERALLTDRNTIVLNRLAGLPKRHRNVTIFFGAAHMPDIERRLVEKGYRRAGGRWLTAWDIAD